jgi:hypothetical protein
MCDRIRGVDLEMRTIPDANVAGNGQVDDRLTPGTCNAVGLHERPTDAVIVFSHIRRRLLLFPVTSTAPDEATRVRTVRQPDAMTIVNRPKGIHRKMTAERTVREVTHDLLRSLGLTTVFGNPGSTEETFLKNFPDDFTYILGLQEASVMAMGNLIAAYKGNTPSS